MKIKKVAVIGGGTMGNGIAQVTSMSGIEVGLVDVQEEFLTRAKTTIETSLNRTVKKGKITEEEKEEIIGRITFSTNMEAIIKDADLIIEAVPEILELKKSIFEKLDVLCKSDAIIATNTSQYSITEIASAVSDPTRVIGTHWFNPPVMMKVIEIVMGFNTSEETLQVIREFATNVGKEIVVCKDSQGFISTRVLVALRLECYRILEEGIASKEDIDKILRLAFGHPMGQFELADFSGLDIEVPICEGLAKVFGDRFRPPQKLVQLVKAGRFGRKNGKGWYDYE